MLRRIALSAALAAALFCIPVLPGQDEGDLPAAPAPAPLPQAGSRPSRTGDPLRDEQIRRMEKQRSLDRHKQIKKDTDRLLELATELKNYVDKTNENILSVDVIRKAEEIEKLAKQVRTKMRDTVETPGIR